MPITVAPGDGIGPEIMDAVLKILKKVDVPLDFEMIEMGKGTYDKGHLTGMTPESKKSVERNGILLKGPMETPKGGGVKSINVTARKTWNTHSNIRVFRTIKGVETVFSKAGIPIDITIVRENIEDTYGGIEHRMSDDVAVSRRLITRPGSQQVIRSAFEVARKEGYKKVSCGHKANIMKLTDGMFLNTFYEIAKEYPDIEVDDVIVDALCMKLVYAPQQFEVVVLTNLQGDIVSDLCAGLVGGLGFAPSANLGDDIKIFEAVHGTAPDIAGKGLANPTSLLLSSAMMLREIGLSEHADVIREALNRTIDKGIHTGDFGEDRSNSVGTEEFSDAICDEIEAIISEKGKPKSSLIGQTVPLRTSYPLLKSEDTDEEVVGIDLFVVDDCQPEILAEKTSAYLKESESELILTTITNRGTQVWPEGSFFTNLVEIYRIRLESKVGDSFSRSDLLRVATDLSEVMRIGSTEMLISIDSVRQYSLGQGQIG